MYLSRYATTSTHLPPGAGEALETHPLRGENEGLGEVKRVGKHIKTLIEEERG